MPVSASLAKALLQRHGQRLGESDADKAACSHGVAVVNQPHGFLGRNDLVRARSLGCRVTDM